MTDLSVYRTPPQQEFKAEQELRDAGIKATVPVEYRWRRSGSARTRRHKVKVPMAPGYVIASSGLPMARYVRKRIGRIQPSEMTHLETIAGKEERNPDLPAPLPQWKPGDKAVIASGPFQGIHVTVLEHRGKAVICEGVAAGGFCKGIAVHVLQLAKVTG